MAACHASNVNDGVRSPGPAQICSGCGREVEEFVRGKKCRDCTNAYFREYHKKNGWQRSNSDQRRRSEKRDWYASYKSNLSCLICGENEPVCLDFHHKNPDEKDFSIGARMSSGVSIERMIQEIEKCVVLCSNCHRKIHAGLISLPH